VGFQGLLSPKNRSLLGVNDDFEGKRKVAIKSSVIEFTQITET
jgi:hypothetical protein